MAVVLLAGCKTDRDRAKWFVENGQRASAAGDERAAMASFEEALRLAPDLRSAQQGRAQSLARSLAKSGDVDKALESLATCDDSSCASLRRSIAADELKKPGGQPFADEAGALRHLRLLRAAGQSTWCELVTATAALGPRDDAKRRVLATAFRSEVDRLTAQTRQSTEKPVFKMAHQLGASALGARTCDDVRKVSMGLLGFLTTLPGQPGPEPAEAALADQAFDLGLFSAKLVSLASSGASAQALSRVPLRSPADLSGYLDAAAKAGYARDCAVFMAILRVERLPPARRGAVKGPLKAAIAALAPKNGTKDEFKLGGRDTIPLDAVASGAQSCEELEALYAQTSAAAAKVGAALAAVGGDSGGTVISVDRTAFMYTALRARFEHPMSTKDVRDHDDAQRYAADAQAAEHDGSEDDDDE
jgi:hypothetical protein